MTTQIVAGMVGRVRIKAFKRNKVASHVKQVHLNTNLVIARNKLTLQSRHDLVASDEGGLQYPQRMATAAFAFTRKRSTILSNAKLLQTNGRRFVG